MGKAGATDEAKVKAEAGRTSKTAGLLRSRRDLGKGPGCHDHRQLAVGDLAEEDNSTGERNASDDFRIGCSGCRAGRKRSAGNGLRMGVSLRRGLCPGCPGLFGLRRVWLGL